MIPDNNSGNIPVCALPYLNGGNNGLFGGNGWDRMIRMRSNEDAVEMIEKAKDLLDSACEMMKNSMDERGGMDYRNQMRDSRGRYSGRDWEREERMMRRDGDWDDMPRGRYGY